MGRRRLGRETAFKALYRVDLTGKGIEEALAGLPKEKDSDPEAVQFAQELLETVGAHREQLNDRLGRAAEHWDMDRMAAVDRAVLTLGAAEILFWRWIPSQVSINEYVEIAKKFSTEESGGFVNAILDRVSRDSQRQEAEH
jgi:transcription antitermination factor NusB